jgi:hypothetical protein
MINIPTIFKHKSSRPTAAKSPPIEANVQTKSETSASLPKKLRFDEYVESRKANELGRLQGENQDLKER